MANAKILNYEWKKSFDKSLATPMPTLISFYDLLFWNDGKNDLARFHSQVTPDNYKSKGYELAHNIIAFDENIYQMANYSGAPSHREINKNFTDTPIPGTSSFSDFIDNGIDLSLPKYDLRSKPLFLTEQNVTKYVKNVQPGELTGIINQMNTAGVDASDFYAGKGRGIKIWDKSSIMRPTDSYDFYTGSANYNNNSAEPNTWNDYDNPYTVATEKDGANHIEAADIILSNEDISFESRFLYLPTDPSYKGIRAFNGLCGNYSSESIWKIFWKIYKGQTRPFQLIDVTSSTKIATISNLEKFLLQNAFLFVKASYYADYIDYKDFDQSLNKLSDVIHKNLLVTDTGDLKRYNNAYSKGTINANDLAKNTRPYLSKTPPSLDLVAPLMLADGQFIPNDPTGTISKIIDDSNGPYSKIGSLNIEPFEFDTQEEGITSGEQVQPPPSYFDPESRKDATDYNDIPIIIPRDGNVQTSGRVISPTIDELWQEIKMLIGGRVAELPTTIYPDGGYPVGEGESRVPVDTRPSIKSHRFSATGHSANGAIGDPIDIYYNFTDPVNATYQVISWINNPTKINYKLLNEVKSLNDLLCQAFNNAGREDWKKLSSAFVSLLPPNDSSKGDTAALYNPSDKPFSLRELEAYIKGLRWNLTYLISFLVRNNTWAGCVAYPNKDPSPNAWVASTNGNVGKAYNINDGTVYQLHKDYDGVYNDPNTVYDQRANYGPFDPVYNTNGMPAGVKGIGLGPIDKMMVGDDQETVPSWAVYMGADGQFHSQWQCINVPIIEEEF